MIFNYSALRGGANATMGSFAVHLAVVIATWVSLQGLVDDEEYLDGLVRPRSLMIFLTILHFTVSIVQAMNWTLDLCDGMEII